MATLGDRVRQRREQMGLTQRQLAAAAKITQQSIQAIESGKAQGTKHLVKIAAALHLRPEQLEGDEPLPPPPAALSLSWPFQRISPRGDCCACGDDRVRQFSLLTR